jgi:hypothetical protein
MSHTADGAPAPAPSIALRKRRLAEMINLSARTSRREIAAMVQDLRSLANPLGDDVPRMPCMVCGTPFEARSDDARFCSGRCRIRNWRAQR